MLGFLRPSCCTSQTIFRQIYAGFCANQNRKWGIESLFFLSYEAIFLYLFAVDAKWCDGPSEEHVRCFRLSQGNKRVFQVDSAIGEFVSAFGLLLAKIKLEDDIADNQSWLAWFGQWKLKRQTQRSETYFCELDPAFIGQVTNFLQAHQRLEQSDKPIPLDEYVQPTADAFGYVFSLLANLRKGERKEHHDLLCATGEVDWSFDYCLRLRGRLET